MYIGSKEGRDKIKTVAFKHYNGDEDLLKLDDGHKSTRICTVRRGKPRKPYAEMATLVHEVYKSTCRPRRER